MTFADQKLGTVAPPSRRDEILQAIAQEEARVAELEADQANARCRLAAP